MSRKASCFSGTFLLLNNFLPSFVGKIKTDNEPHQEFVRGSAAGHVAAHHLCGSNAIPQVCALTFEYPEQEEADATDRVEAPHAGCHTSCRSV